MNYVINPRMTHSDEESYIKSFFRARGFNLEDIDDYLIPKKESLYDPFLLGNIDAGAELLKKHLDLKSVIYLVVD